MGSSKQTQKQTQTRDPYSPAKPAINQSIAGVQSWLSDPASSAAYQGGMSDWTRSGLENMAASSGANASKDYLTDVLSGKYLAQDNPWQADLDASIRSAVMPSINATFSNAGMAGSTMHQGMLMKGLTEGLAAPRYQNYQAERSAQGQAAGLLPQVDAQAAQQALTAGQIKEGYDKAQWDENRTAGLRPYLETQGLLGTYGNMGGTSTGTSTSSSSPSLGQQILGGGMMGLSMLGGGSNPLGMIGAQTRGLFGGNVGINPWSYSIGS